jgi:AraC-like DNA-binding protein
MDPELKKVDSASEDYKTMLASRSENGVTVIPAHLGTGYIKGFFIANRLRLLVRQYELKEDLLLDRGIGTEERNYIMFSFQNLYQSKDEIKARLMRPSSGSSLLPSVQVATSGFNQEILPGHKKINSIVITVHADYLKDLLSPASENKLLNMIISSDKAFLFEEIISPQIQDVAAEIVMSEPPVALQNLFYQVKAEELIYLLFAELLKRENTTLQNLNAADVKKIFEVKDKVLATIATPPKLSDLVGLSGMSESKLKRLFKQIFGISIYNYYQAFRMKEAAYLIKEENLSVSEAGYRVGFSNLSHFTRLFELHNGIKPKKYSAIK